MELPKGSVYVYKIPKPTATKISEIVNGKNQKRLNQTKITRGISERFQPLISAKTRRLATGLDVEVDNPYKGEQVSDPDFQFLSIQDKALLQNIIEYKFNRKKGELHSEPADPNQKKYLENPSFFQTFVYHLNDGVTVFDLSNFNNLLAYYCMLASKKFANSKKEYESGKFPDADYYLASVDEGDFEKFTKKQVKDRAKAELTMGVIADSETQKKFVRLLLPTAGKGKLTDAQCYNLISEAVDTNERYKDGEEFLTKYNKLINLLKDAPGKARFNALVLLQEGLNSFVLSEKAGTYTWLAKDMIIGASKEKAVEFMLDPNKGDLVEELQEQILARKAKYELI